MERYPRHVEEYDYDAADKRSVRWFFKALFIMIAAAIGALLAFACTPPEDMPAEKKDTVYPIMVPPADTIKR